MPLYEYQCEACSQRFEVIQKFSDPPPDSCRVCGKGPVQRQLSSPAIQFKGTGWYITDYSQKGKPPSSESQSSSKSESKSGESSAPKADSGGSSSSSAPAASSSTPSTPSKSE